MTSTVAKESPIRLGLIGAGNVVSNYHLPILQSLESVRLGWITDPNLARAEEVARIFGIASAHAALEACGEVDAVLVAAPVGARKPIMETITKRGWHAFCEKPFAATSADHEWMIELARTRKIQLGVGLVRRFYETTMRARAIVGGGLLGPVHEILAGEGLRARKFGRGADWYQGNADASGGVFFETGSHLVDQVFTICGVESYELEACEQRHSGALEIETRALASVTLKDGARVPLRIAVSRLTDVYNGIVVRCRNGELRVPLDPEATVDLCTTAGEVVGRLPGAPKPGLLPALRGEWEEFLQRCGARSGDPADTGLLTTAFIEGAYRLARESMKSDRRGMAS